VGLSTRGALAAGALVVVAAGCTSGPVASAPPKVAVAAGLDHACIVPGTATPTVAWARLSNPILGEPHAGVKDQALIWDGGRWHMLFSEVTDDAALPGGVRWDIATATSTDLVHWSAPVR